MTHGSLFSGIGGFDLAAEWMGWENKFHCEWNEFGQKVLHYYWPNAELFTDITKSDFTKYANKIDVLTGGFPCQPYSQAGKRLGKEDDRHLWPEMLRAIREIKPSWVVGENVYGLVNWNGGLVFHEVQSDLEAEGYEVWPFLLPAAAVNAPHRRDRIWFIANSQNNGWNGRECKQREGTEIDQREFCEHKTEGWDEIRSKSERYSQKGTSSDSNNNGFYATKNRQGLGKGNDYNTARKNKTIKLKRCSNEKSKIVTNTTKQGLERLRREERRCTKLHTRYNENRGWETFPTVSPICNGDDGFSNRLDSITFPKWRNESIKAGGNAIVPQVVYQIFKAIEQYEHQRPSNTTNR
jgi:DNA (cytosine-5)-methyltransferase 1